MILHTRVSRLSALLPGLALIAAAPAIAAVLHVPADLPTIQDGIDAAASGDTVEVACGLYFESGLTIHAKDVHLVSEHRTPSCATIDAQFQRTAVTFKAATGTLQGFRISGGVTGGGGGGALIYEGSVADVLDCMFVGNYSASNGGGIAVVGADATIRGTTIVGNDAQGSLPRFGGGGLHVRGISNVVVTNCTIADNTGPVPGIMVAGGLSSVSLDRCIVANGGCPFNVGSISNSCLPDCSVGGSNLQADALFCDAAGGDYRLDGASPCLPPGNPQGMTIGSEPLGCGTSRLVRAVVTTTPPGQKLLVDGVPAFSPAGFDWQLYSRHIVEVAETIPLSAGDRLRFDGWSDGGAKGHAVYVDLDGLLFDATLARQYALTTSVIGAGTVAPSGGWFDAGVAVDVLGQPDPGMHLEGWQGTGSGAYTGPSNPAPVVMNSAVSQQVTFAPIAHDFTVSASDTNPFELAAPATHGIRNLYLWATCANAGLSAMGAGVTGSLVPYGFVPLNGVLNAGSSTDLLLAVPACPTGTSAHALLGYWIVDDSGGDLCLGAGSTGPAEAVACGAPFLVTAPRIAGFSSTGTAPCAVGTDLCGLPNVPVRREAAGRLPAPPADAFTLGPNPFSTAVRFRAPGEHGQALEAAVHDVAGRTLRTLDDVDTDGWMQWDGRDADGRRVPSGVYFLRIVAERGTTTRKVTHLRMR